MKEIKQAFGDADDIVNKASSIIASGVNSVNGVLGVYTNMKAATNAGLDHT